MPGIRRTRAASDEDVAVTHYVCDKHGVRIFRVWFDPVTGARLRDDNGQGPFYNWAAVAAELSQVQADKLRRLPYKLMGATNVEADAAIVADDAASSIP